MKNPIILKWNDGIQCLKAKCYKITYEDREP